jgi:putative restriction endonuclease
MPVKLLVAVTDRAWFDHLRAGPLPAEVNFWAPSARSFQALEPGELFLFKLHAPDNFIVGGGFFAHATDLPCSIAWEAFGGANGAATLAEMRARIIRYRRTSPDDRGDFIIGCRVLTQPFFLSEDDWIAVPSSWSRNIVAFKTYDAGEGDGLALWEAVQERLEHQSLVAGVAEAPAARFGEPVLIRPRLGQGAFRILVTDLYHRRCAVTGERTLPALDAAHIRPYADGGPHEASNGLLLRRDIHSIFDAGYVTVTPDYRFEVSRRIREDYENGRQYYALHGTAIAVPERVELRPDKAALSWHNEHLFRG